MKSLIAILVLLSSVAFAGEIKVYEVEAGPWSQFIRGNFAVNASMGRAWVSVEVSERLHGSRRDSTSSYRNVGIPGLSFDSASQKIMLDLEGQLIECGYRTGRGIFRRIKETNCHFESRKEWRTYDDGFNTYRMQVLQLFLVTE